MKQQFQRKMLLTSGMLELLVIKKRKPKVKQIMVYSNYELLLKPQKVIH